MLPPSSPPWQFNSFDWLSFKQGNVQGQQLPKGHWNSLCSSELGFAENYTAIKQSTYFYADIYGTQGEGCIMAVEVLYEGIGTTGSVATCPALKWALSSGVTTEGNSQDTAERNQWGEHFLSVDHLCAMWNHRYLLSGLINTHLKASQVSSAADREVLSLLAFRLLFPQLSELTSVTWIITNTENWDALHFYIIMSFSICHCLNWHLIFFLQT